MTESADKARRSAYIPVLPDTWTVAADIHGPDGARVTIAANGPSQFQVSFATGPGAEHQNHETDTLHEAFRIAARGIHRMERLREEREALADAERTLLDDLL